MAKKIFIIEVEDDNVGVKSLYHIFDNTWLYKKIVITEQKAPQQGVQSDCSRDAKKVDTSVMYEQSDYMSGK